jgi:hypothetical protein
MTIRSLDLIVAADVIVHDRLYSPDALAAARPDAEILYVGKGRRGERSAGGHEELLIDRLRARQDRRPAEGRRPFARTRAARRRRRSPMPASPSRSSPG